jgi:putative FmdB family regulatory protein
MPLYDYDCAACGRRVEVFHGVYAPGPTHCPTCGSGPMRKAITAAAVHYKGTGWAKRDRRVSVAPGAKPSGDTVTASEGDGKADSSTKDAKSEPKSDGAVDAGVKDGAKERPAASSQKTKATAATTGD